MIETYELTKDFVMKDKSVHAVRSVTFSVGQGEIFGLLGPNGAGKTTTLRMLCTLLAPTAGWARVCGFDTLQDDYEIRKRIGVSFGGYMVYRRITGRENLEFYGRMYGVRKSSLGRRIKSLADFFGLSDRLDSLVETYSWGMICKLSLARAMIHDPQVLLLDEPTVGLDPRMATDLRSKIRGLSREGRTVVLSTHYMAEAQMLCDRVGFIFGGRLIAQGRPDELISGIHATDMLVVETTSDTRGLDLGLGEAVEEGALRIPIRDARQIGQVIERLEGAGIALGRIRFRPASLEEVFLHYDRRN